jgi:hypothetical protein
MKCSLTDAKRGYVRPVDRLVGVDVAEKAMPSRHV